jgi:transposase
MSRSQLSYVGIDAHKSGSNVCAMGGDGRIICEKSCGRGPQELIRVLHTIPGHKHVVLEETTIADLLYRELQPHVHRIIVANPRQNALISKNENLDDQTAAQLLAHLLRLNFVKPVHHASSPTRQEFKRLVLFHIAQTRRLVQAKNQLQAIFTSYLIPCKSGELYSPQSRAPYLDKLPGAEARFRAQTLMSDIDHTAAQLKRIDRQITRQGRQYPPIKLFQQLPGIGDIRSATWFALIDTPDRFASRAHLWAYCGIGIARRRSGEKAGPKHLNRNGNPILKDLLKGAAMDAITKHDHNRFENQYQDLLADHVNPALARLTVARAIATTMLTIWKTGEDYQEHYVPRLLR